MLDWRYIIEWLLFGLAAVVVLYGLITAVGMLIASYKNQIAMRLLSLCLLLLSLTIGHEALLLNGWYDQHTGWRFLPICFSMAIGPAFFFYVKARLYPSFRLKWNDTKHFLLAIGQVSAYLALYFSPAYRKEALWEGLYRYYIHPGENILFVITFSIYLFFSYRFIKHALRHAVSPAQRLLPLRLKRTAKVLQLLAGFFALYLIDDTIRRLLLLRAQTDLTWVSWVSFAALLGMLAWLSLFAWLQEYWWPRREKLNVTRFVKKLVKKSSE